MTQSQWKTVLIYLPAMKIQFLSLYSLLEGDLQSRIERLDYDDHCEKKVYYQRKHSKMSGVTGVINK